MILTGLSGETIELSDIALGHKSRSARRAGTNEALDLDLLNPTDKDALTFLIGRRVAFEDAPHSDEEMIVADEPVSALHITIQQVVANQLRPFCTHRVTETDVSGAAPDGGTACIL